MEHNKVYIVLMCFFLYKVYATHTRKPNLHGRGISDFFVMDRPNEDNVLFFMCTKDFKTEKLRMSYKVSADSLRKVNFDGNKDTVFIIHGFGENPNTTGWIRNLGDDWTFREKNAIVVDWMAPSGTSNYFKATSNVEQVGKVIADFIDSISITAHSPLNKFHLIGHSLGAHVSGHVGKYLKGKLGRITGLDPASPFYEGKDASTRLWYTDALFVESIHTDHSTLIPFGMKEPCSHVDVYPNGGENQPGCQSDHWFLPTRASTTKSCNHHRSVVYYQEAVFGPEHVIVNACEDYEAFKQGKCKECGKAQNDCFKLGENSPSVLQQLVQTPKKKFYIDTPNKGPYFSKTDIWKTF